ncbi:hypothetical protein KC19_N001200 [Ceratodon purpureus]|nr:hypothetical protein KC19_N001200 [Ceratodon purpureus]
MLCYMLGRAMRSMPGAWMNFCHNPRLDRTSLQVWEQLLLIPWILYISWASRSNSKKQETGLRKIWISTKTWKLVFLRRLSEFWEDC